VPAAKVSALRACLTFVEETVSQTVSLTSSTCKIPMICCSVRIVRFIVRPFLGADSGLRWRKNPVAGHYRRDVDLPTPVKPFGPEPDSARQLPRPSRLDRGIRYPFSASARVSRQAQDQTRRNSSKAPEIKVEGQVADGFARSANGGQFCWIGATGLQPNGAQGRQ
jgi:hypothetical protein